MKIWSPEEERKILERLSHTRGWPATRSDMRRSIRNWTEEEKSQLIRAVTQLRLNNPIAHITNLVRTAQLGLPIHRQRKIKSTHGLEWLIVGVQKQLQDMQMTTEQNGQQPDNENQVSVSVPVTPEEQSMKKTKTNKTYLRWMRSERTQVVQRAVQIKQQQPLISDDALLHEAQSELPIVRQRAKFPWSTRTKLMTAINKQLGRSSRKTQSTAATNGQSTDTSSTPVPPASTSPELSDRMSAVVSAVDRMQISLQRVEELLRQQANGTYAPKKTRTRVRLYGVNDRARLRLLTEEFPECELVWEDGLDCTAAMFVGLYEQKATDLEGKFLLTVNVPSAQPKFSALIQAIAWLLAQYPSVIASGEAVHAQLSDILAEKTS